MFRIVLSIEEVDEAGVLLADPKYCTVAVSENEADIRGKYNQFLTVMLPSVDESSKSKERIQVVQVGYAFLCKLLNQLKADEQFASIAICAAPTGPDRNVLTEINILRMDLLRQVRELLKPCTKCSADATRCPM